MSTTNDGQKLTPKLGGGHFAGGFKPIPKPPPLTPPAVELEKPMPEVVIVHPSGRVSLNTMGIGVCVATVMTLS